MGPTARELFLTILCPSARFQRGATGGKRLSMPLSGMKSVRWQTSGEKTFLQVVWWLRHGASTSTRTKVRNGEVRGSYIKPSRLYLSLKHCRPNKNYGVGGRCEEWAWSFRNYWFTSITFWGRQPRPPEPEELAGVLPGRAQVTMEFSYSPTIWACKCFNQSPRSINSLKA